MLATTIVHAYDDDAHEQPSTLSRPFEVLVFEANSQIHASCALCAPNNTGEKGQNFYWILGHNHASDSDFSFIAVCS